jgi:hypothetical protein
MAALEVENSNYSAPANAAVHEYTIFLKPASGAETTLVPLQSILKVEKLKALDRAEEISQN